MKIQRILLIRPGARFSDQIFAQPLGLLYLASVLRREFPGELELQLVEQALYDLNLEQVGDRIREFRPDLVAFSCLSVEAEEMHRVAALAKQIQPSCRTVLGGPHASVFFDYSLKDPNLDVAVLNEGEITFPELIRAWREDQPLEAVPGLAFRRRAENGGRAEEPDLVQTPPRPLLTDLDSIPFPAWDLIDFAHYGRQISMNTTCHSFPWAAIFTSRGCPYQCIYCHHLFGKKARLRSVANVIAEIELLTRTYGVRELQIVDDIFNLDLERAKRICDEIVARGIQVKIAFPNALRGDRMDRELIRKLKPAGCYSITYAVETASPRLQKLIKKNLNLDKVRQAIAWTFEEGLLPHGFFMLGFPGETREEMKRTVDWAVNSKLLRAWFFSVMPYPRTEIYELARREYPDFPFGQWEFSKLHYHPKMPFYTRATGVDLFKIQRNANRRFYLRPRLIWNLFWRSPKNRVMFRGLYWALRGVFPFLYQLEPRFRPLRKFLVRHRLFWI